MTSNLKEENEVLKEEVSFLRTQFRDYKLETLQNLKTLVDELSCIEEANQRLELENQQLRQKLGV
jgi:hypothetical protein